MKYGFTRAALVSPKIKAGAVDYNKEQVLKGIFRAAEKNAELIVCGRLSLSGISCDKVFCYSTLLQSCIDSLASIVTATQSLSSVIVVGLPLRVFDRVMDCSAVICGGNVLAFVPHDGSENGFSVLGSGETHFIKMNGRDVPLSRDIVFYNTEMDYSFKFFDSKNLPHTEIVLRPLVSPKIMGSERMELELSRVYSRLFSCAVLSVSCGQTHRAGSGVFCGHRMATELGEALNETRGNDDVLIAEIDVGGITHANTIASSNCAAGSNDLAFGYLKSTRAGDAHGAGASAGHLTVDFACNSNDSELERTLSRYPLCPASEADCRDVIDILTASIKAKMQEAGHEKVIFGLSGGLDSAHLALMCYKLFTKEGLPLENIIAVTMNSDHTSARTAKNAKRLIELLCFSSIDAPITDAVSAGLKQLQHEEIDNVYENAQARQRALTLLNLANKHNALLLGTGDLSELCLGWTTYGGDTMAHYNPNGGITKTAIRVIIKYLAETLSYREAANVLLDILGTPISPELKENQETEKLIGSYEVHDFFLYCLIKKGYDVEKTLFLSTRTFPHMQRKDLHQNLTTFVTRFFRFRFKQQYSCESPSAIFPDLLPLVMGIRSGISAEQWQKELSNLKI